MSIMYKPTEPLEVGIGESMPAEFVREAKRSRARIVSLIDEIKRLKTENAKLRELVIAQCECVKHDDCNECVHYFEGKCMFPFKSMYRELGVEVTE